MIIVKRIFGSLRLILLKLRYMRCLNINLKCLKSNIESLSCISIIKGKIKLNGKIFLRKNSVIAVNGGTIEIGSDTSINRNTLCCSQGKIIIGNSVSIGPNVSIYDHDHFFNENGKIKNKYRIGKVEIGDNVWIGANVVILRDSVIGENTIIGAGTIVSGVIPSNSIVTSDRKINIKKLIKK